MARDQLNGVRNGKVQLFLATNTMVTEKQSILHLIRQLATENGGKAPGAHRFESLTGIRKSEWYSKLWLRIELPEKVQPIHVITTDDPVGIENYWHSRFHDKRKEGEWFALSAEDVRAFKRWKRIY